MFEDLSLTMHLSDYFNILKFLPFFGAAHIFHIGDKMLARRADAVIHLKVIHFTAAQQWQTKEGAQETSCSFI